MDSLEVTKIAGAFLTAGIVASLSGFIASEIHHVPELEQAAYVVTPAEDAGGEQAQAAAEPEAKDIGTLLAAAEPSAGESVAKKCSACHTWEQGGANRIGPNLWGVVQRPIASAEGFQYSDALAAKSGQAWTYENLDAFIESPRDWAPGTKMSFAGIRKAKDRADLLAYLRTLSDDPAPLPE